MDEKEGDQTLENLAKLCVFLSSFCLLDVITKDEYSLDGWKIRRRGVGNLAKLRVFLSSLRLLDVITNDEYSLNG